MKSIGDFALNLIPKLDSAKLTAAATGFSALRDVGKDIYGLGKGGYNFLSQVAENISAITKEARLLDMPIKQFYALTQAFESVEKGSGSMAKELVLMTKNFSEKKSWGLFGDAVFGQGRWNLGQLKSDPIAFLMTALNKIKGMPLGRQQSIMQEFGGAPMLKVLKNFEPFMQMYKFSLEKGLSTKDAGIAEQHVLERQKLGIQREALKASIFEQLSGTLTSIDITLNKLLSWLNEDAIKKTKSFIEKAFGWTESKKDWRTLSPEQLRDKVIQNIKNVDYKSLAGKGAELSIEAFKEIKNSLVEAFREGEKLRKPVDVNLKVSADQGLNVSSDKKTMFNKTQDQKAVRNN